MVKPLKGPTETGFGELVSQWSCTGVTDVVLLSGVKLIPPEASPPRSQYG